VAASDRLGVVLWLFLGVQGCPVGWIDEELRDQLKAARHLPLPERAHAAEALLQRVVESEATFPAMRSFISDVLIAARAMVT
jgi:hypothetical protein